MNSPPSTADCRLSTVDCRLSTVDCRCPRVSIRSLEAINQRLAGHVEDFRMQQPAPESFDEGDILVVLSDATGDSMRQRAGGAKMAYLGANCVSIVVSPVRYVHLLDDGYERPSPEVAMDPWKFNRRIKCVFLLLGLCVGILVSCRAVRIYWRTEAVLRISRHCECVSFYGGWGGRLYQLGAHVGRNTPTRAELFYVCAFPILHFDINEADASAVMELGTFSEIQKLSLSNCNFDDQAMLGVSALSNLRVIELSSASAVTDRGVSELRACPRLKEIKLFAIGTSSGRFLRELRCQDTLTVFELASESDSDIRFDDESLQLLADYYNLRRVSIEFGFFEGYGFTVFSKLPKLEFLRIEVPNEDARKCIEHIPNVEGIEHGVEQYVVP